MRGKQATKEATKEGGEGNKGEWTNVGPCDGDSWLACGHLCCSSSIRAVRRCSTLASCTTPATLGMRDAKPSPSEGAQPESA